MVPSEGTGLALSETPAKNVPTMNGLIRCALVVLFLVGESGDGFAAQFAFPGHTITVPEGFEVEQVAGPPLVLRPMMADFDEEGRLYVADSSGSNDPVDRQLEDEPHRIVRLEDSDGDGRFDQSVVFADRLMFPEGVLWHEGAVYTGAPPSIWRLEDTDDDGVADRRSEWHQGLTLTGCANDLHGPYQGPDGWIYWCKGAFARQTFERPGHRPIADSAAHVYRALPDHSHLDAVMSGGMDNPVEVAFSREGEVFFITTFFHHPEAGRRDAVVHCIYGGVYPKVHGVLDDLQRTGDLLPSLVELGPAAACALTRYDSAQWGAEYENNLFSTEFNLRKVMRHVLEPVGSTYRARNEDFLVSDNPDFHPTDVWEDADGSLMVIDTGGWYKICCPTSQLAKPDVLGGVYRIRRAGASRVRDPRGLSLAWEGQAPEVLIGRLDDSRPAVRERAIRHLARIGPSAVGALRQVVSKASSTVAARRNAVWALTRIEDPAARAAVRRALEDGDPGVQQAALHSVGMRRDAAALQSMLRFLGSTNWFHQRKAAEAMGRIGDSAAVPALLQTAGTFREHFPSDAAAVRVHEHALIFALIEIADATATRTGLGAENPFVRRAALIALDQMDGGDLRAADVAPLLAAEDPVLKSTAVWVAGHHAEWGEELTGFFRDRLRSELRSDEEQVELRRQLAVFERHPAIQELVGEALADDTLSGATRLAVLGSMEDSGLEQTPSRWVGPLMRCWESADEDVVRGALSVVRALSLSVEQVEELKVGLLRLGNDSMRPRDLRVEALAAVRSGAGAVDAELFTLLLEQLEPDLPAIQRGASASVLIRADLSAEQRLGLARRLSQVGPMELNRLLEAFMDVREPDLGHELLMALQQSAAVRSLRVDLLKECVAQFPAAVRAEADELLRLLDADAEEQAAHLEALLSELSAMEGDVRRGQVVFNSEKTACATCHAIGYLGGKVGPDLTSIGQIRTERDLLEAVIYPSASFVRSYEPVIVSTSDGEEYSGVLANETTSELQLTLGANANMRLARADVVEIRPGTVSVMPSGLDTQLTRQELADLLAFLHHTRWGPR